jgi:predicted permease
LRGINRSTRDTSALPQKSLIVLQAALSLVLLSVAGLLAQSLRNLENQEFGFERQGRLIVQMDPIAAGYTQERLTGLYQQMTDRFSHLPGVITASLSLYTAQQGNNWGEEIFIPGNTQKDLGSSWVRVSAHYFETIGTPMVRGRGIGEQDTATSQHVAVINESFARKYFPNQDPIGKHFGKDQQTHASDYEIVGVAKDAKYQDASKPARPMFFVPLPQKIKYETLSDQRVEDGSMYMGSLELHVAGDPDTFASDVRRIMAEIDPNLTPLSIRSFAEQVKIHTSTRTLMARLSSSLGILALVLASIGLYGVTAYRVARRTSEVGIRMTLGATRRDIVALILRGAFSQVGLGLLIGVPLVFLVGRLVSSLLFGVGSFSTLVLVGAISVLGCCALLATVLPALRAAAIEPVEALRTE